MAHDPEPVNVAPPSPGPRRGSRHAVHALAIAASIALAGCSFFDATPVQRGNRVAPEDLAQITPGVQTRQDVQALLGSPSARSTFNDREWYYISSVTRQRPGRQLAVNNRRIVAISFDGDGKVREVRELDDADHRQVAFVSRETPVPGNDRTLLQDLFGNIGRFGGPSALSQQGPGPTGPTTGPDAPR
jgi:outer membrane protein assembly factor BamE (lipoprotein component of BamABCDE complex)